MAIETTSISALSLILYYFQFERSDHIEWDEFNLKKLSGMYESDKLLTIDQHIENYFAKNDIEISAVLPGAKRSNSEKENLLRSISAGIKILTKNNN